MSFEVLTATVNETTVAAADTELDDLAAAACDLVATESAVKMTCQGKMTVQDGSSNEKVFSLDIVAYEVSEAKIKDVIAQYTAAMTAIEGASTYTSVQSVKIKVKFVVTE